jgi:hypothetical protein
MRTPKETAEHMVEKYGTKSTAMEYATGFQMLYNKHDFGFAYWEEVQTEIKAYAPELSAI